MKSEPGRSGAKPRNTLPPPAGAVTLEMVAKEAGVSASTVSRILNGTAQVRDSKARAVNAAIAKLRFMPNPVAQSLARGRSMSVGVITQAISSPFYAEALAAIETQLLRANYSPLFMSGHWVEADERRCIDHLLSRRVGGIILLTSCLPDAELIALSRRTPLLLMGRRVAANQIVSLDDDDTASARLATDFLISLGHRRIAFIAGTETRPDARQRFTGYKAALAAHKIPFQAKLVANGNYSDAGGYAAMNALLDSGEEFSAAFAANDQSAYGALLALYRHGLKVPRDMSVVGFDDLPGSAFTVPPLTTVHRSIDQIGQSAAEAMVDLIEGRDPVIRKPRVSLSIRESTRQLSG